MAQGDGSSALTESGRTPLAVMLGDTGEIERELEEALGRLTESTPGSTEEEAPASRYRTGLFEPPPPPRLHASVIGGRIQSLAEEAYGQELQRRREEDPSGRHPLLPGAPTAPARVRTLEEDAVANLPWELRRYLVPSQEPRDRIFVYGAAVGALIAVVAAGATFTGILLLQPQLLRAVAVSAPVAQPVVGPAPAAAIAAPAAGTAPEVSTPSTGSTPTATIAAVTSAAPVAASAVPPAPPTSAGPTLKASPPPVTVAAALSQVELTGRAHVTPQVPAPPATQAAGGETPAKLEQRPRAPRVVQEVPLAAKEESEEEVAFVEDEDEGTAPAQVAAGAALEEDTAPPPTVKELDDAFDRQFGVASPAPPAAEENGKVRPPVFVPAPVAQLPETLGNGEVMAVVISHKDQVAGCVNAHAVKSGERRSLVLNWVIAPEGDVENVRIESPDHQTSPLGECVRDAVAGWRFGRHQQAQPVRFPFAY